MGPSRLQSSWLGLVIAAMLVPSAPASAGTTQNLLVNGNAELQSCTRDWTAQTSVPGWRVVRGAASVLCYAAFGFTGQTPATPADKPAGKALFGAPGADTEMEQVVDVSAAGAGIDKGAVSFDLSGWLGGWRDRPERATLTAIFLDADGNATGDPVTITDADAHARHGATELLQRQATGLVPRYTRQIAVTLNFLSGMTSFHDAYADNISLTLSGTVPTFPAQKAVPPASSIPALDHVYVVMMENTNYADVFHTAGAGAGVTVDPKMPFFASLAQSGVVLANMWGVYHPSDQNYVAMAAGNTYKFGPVYFPNYRLPVTHLGNLLDEKRKSWRAYVQNMKSPCKLDGAGAGGTSYSPDDQPFVQFTDVIENRTRCVAHIRDLGDFETAIANNNLPAFAWLAADDWWDGEGAWYNKYDVAFSNLAQDKFLRTTLQPLIESAQWKQSKSLLIVTWDEADGWGWPDNHVPTILVGSPGLLRAGTVIQEHVDHYDLLRTIESALGLGDLGRLDKFARPLNAAFKQAAPSDLRSARDLQPAGSLAIRGSIAGTFGTATAPAAVDQGQPITLTVPAGVVGDVVVNLEPLGQVPTAASKAYPFDDNAVTIPTARLAPGFYGAWLRHGKTPPYLAPMIVSVLPLASVTPAQPGVEVVGASVSGGDADDAVLREGSNPILRYCLPSGADPATSWVGVFPAGTSPKRMTKSVANTIGFWLKTPGGGPGGTACGDAEAYASELTPDRHYQVLLFQGTGGNGPQAVGRTAKFTVAPSLPHGG